MGHHSRVNWSQPIYPGIITRVREVQACCNAETQDVIQVVSAIIQGIDVEGWAKIVSAAIERVEVPAIAALHINAASVGQIGLQGIGLI